MRILSAADVEGALDWDSLVERLRRAFRRGAVVPVRHHHEIANPGGPEGTLLLMPAWQAGLHIGIKGRDHLPGQ
jgi:ornithine cyclodeaminase